MAWLRTGPKPLSEPQMALWIDANMRQSTSMNLGRHLGKAGQGKHFYDANHVSLNVVDL